MSKAFIHIKNQSAYKRQKYLENMGANFLLSETGSSQLLVHRNLKYFYANSIIKRKYMYLFQDIKRHVKSQLEKHDIDLSEVENSKPLYFKFRDINLEAGEVVQFDNVCQYDVNKAYYTVARNMNIISEEYYKKYLALPKHLRLILIGALATKKTIKTFENGKLVEKTLKEDAVLRAVFKKIVLHTDKVLLQISKAIGEDFLYYWVDGITTKDSKKVEQVVSYYSKKYELDFSFDKLIFVRFEQRDTLTAVVNTGSKEKILMNRKVYKK